MVGPMVGLTHVALRELVRSYVPQPLKVLLFTEMLSSRRLPSERLEAVESLRCSPGESHLVPQLLGNEEKFIEPSVKKLLAQSPWGIDINMGCPTSHTLRHNWGVLLMGDRKYAAEVVRVTKRHAALPISVKMRTPDGDEGNFSYLDDFTKSLEEAGADWITLHCRTRSQGHKGLADWAMVGRLAAKRNIPVVANGDIQTADDALTIMKKFGVDGTMIGRAVTARPWILWQVAHRLGISAGPAGREGETPPLTPEEEGKEYFRAVLKFIDLLLLHFGDNDFALRRFRFFVANGYHWFFFGHDFWRSTMKAKNLEEARSAVLAYCAKHCFSMRNRIQFN